MTYAKITDFASKDYLLTGNPDKIIKGTEINDELVAIENEFTNGVVSKTGNTGSAKMPSGTQAQRDVSPAPGYTRFNTDTKAFEAYDGTIWKPLGATGSVTVSTFTADGVTGTYTLPFAPATENNTQVYLNGVYQNKTGYSVSGLNVVLDAIPSVGVAVEVVTSGVDNIGATSSDLVTYLPAGTGAVATTVQAKLRAIQYSPQDVGASGLGVINDRNALQQAHDNIVATGKFGVLTLPSGSVFKCNTGLTINVSLVRIDGNGSKLDFSGMGAGDALTLTGKGSGDPYNQAVGGIRGVEILGPGAASTTNGIAFNTANEAGPSHITLEGTVVHDFLVGHSFRNNAYTINIHGGSIYACGTGTQQSSGFVNYGERITYSNSSIFNSSLAVDMQNSDGTFVFNACSLDYNARQVYALGGRVLFNNCHIEASTYAAEPFYLSGATGATVVMNGGWLLCTGANAVPIVYVGTTAGKGGGAFFRDVFMNNLTTSAYLATGTGNIEISNPITYDTPVNVQPLLRLDQSLAIDGSFEQATPSDVFITADTAAITSRLTGADIVLSSVAVNPRTGTRALKMGKAFGGGSACAFAFVAPMKAGKRYAGARFWYSKTGAQTGTVFVSYYFAAIRDSQTTPQILKLGTVGSAPNIVLTAATVPYTAVSAGFDIAKAPAWATHLVMEVNAVNMNAGDLYFDDFEAYEY